jgi:Zn-dependent protease
MDLMEIGVKVGLVASARGDNTAKLMGRLTLNPMAHMDHIGTVILPLASILFNLPIFFGWAKPVPVNERNLKVPRIDMFWIALAGPVSNLILAVIGAFFYGLVAKRLDVGFQSAIMILLNYFILANLFLAFFNLIPLNPLDGGKVLARFLPASLNYKLEQNEQLTSMVLLVLIVSGALKILATPVMMAHTALVTFFGAML